MQRDAELHAEQDKRRREEIEARNEADSAVYRSKKLLRDNAGKISDADKQKIDEAISGVNEALKGGDASSIKSASERLNEAWQSVSAELYRAASEKARTGGPEAGQARPGGAERKEGEEVVDAEVVDDQHSRPA